MVHMDKKKETIKVGMTNNKKREVKKPTSKKVETGFSYKYAIKTGKNFMY